MEGSTISGDLPSQRIEAPPDASRRERGEGSGRRRRRRRKPRRDATPAEGAVVEVSGTAPETPEKSDPKRSSEPRSDDGPPDARGRKLDIRV